MLAIFVVRPGKSVATDSSMLRRFGIKPPPAPVLVVDDDEETRDAVACLLESAGYRVLTAVYGHHALFVMDRAEQSPCVILLDLMMPVMDGVEFRAEQLNDPRFRGIPVIVMSAYDDVADSVATLRTRPRVGKPVDPDRLLAAVAVACKAAAP